MRVIAGRYGGRRLKGPGRLDLRPTSDRVRESLFGIIGDRVRDVRGLDLFAGTGSLGIEALSRGAASIVFIEADRRAAGVLRANLEMLGLARPQAEVILAPVDKALQRLAEGDGRFDLVLADPPYERGLLESSLKAVAEYGLTAVGGLIVLEHRATESPLPPPGLLLIDKRVYGDTAVSFLRRREDLSGGS